MVDTRWQQIIYYSKFHCASPGSSWVKKKIHGGICIVAKIVHHLNQCWDLILVGGKTPMFSPWNPVVWDECTANMKVVVPEGHVPLLGQSVKSILALNFLVHYKTFSPFYPLHPHPTFCSNDMLQHPYLLFTLMSKIRTHWAACKWKQCVCDWLSASSFLYVVVVRHTVTQVQYACFSLRSKGKLMASIHLFFPPLSHFLTTCPWEFACCYLYADVCVRACCLGLLSLLLSFNFYKGLNAWFPLSFHFPWAAPLMQLPVQAGDAPPRLRLSSLSLMSCRWADASVLHSQWNRDIPCGRVLGEALCGQPQFVSAGESYGIERLVFFNMSWCSSHTMLYAMLGL